PRASDRTLPISRVIARARRSLCSAMRWANANMISPRLGPGVRCHIGRAAHAALSAIATSAAVPCWNRPMMSRRSAGLRLSNVLPLVESVHSPAMKRRNVGTSLLVASAGGVAVSVMSLSVRSGSDPLDGHRHRAAAAEAQRHEAVAALAAVELVEQRRHDPRAARTDRVAQS